MHNIAGRNTVQLRKPFSVPSENAQQDLWKIFGFNLNYQQNFFTKTTHISHLTSSLQDSQQEHWIILFLPPSGYCHPIYCPCRDLHSQKPKDSPPRLAIDSYITYSHCIHHVLKFVTTTQNIYVLRDHFSLAIDDTAACTVPIYESM